MSASVCASMNSKYPSCVKLSSIEGCGGGMELSRSTSAAQRLSQAFFPLTAEASASEGLERLSNSFPTLSACLSKNLCNTIESVSSYGRPIHSSGSSGSPLVSYFWDAIRINRPEPNKSGTHVEITQETSDDDNIILEEVVERGHMDLFPEEHVIGKILNDFRDNHKPSLHGRLVFLW